MDGLKKSLYGFSVFMDVIYKALVLYSKVVLVLIVFIVSAQVISRTMLGGSIRWSEEVARLLMVWMAFISMAIGIQKGLHVSIELFYNMFPKPFQLFVDKLAHLLITVCGGVMIYYGLVLIESTSKSTLSATQWPASTLYLMIPVSGIFIIYFSLVGLFGLENFVKTPLGLREDETSEALSKTEGSEI